MKKVFGIIAVAALVITTSCKKDYQCCISGQCIDYNQLDNSTANTTKAACEASQGTWSTK